MGLRLKFNLALLAVFIPGIGISAYLSYNLLHKNAREEVLRNAGVMMEAALSMRAYTVGQVRDKLAQSDEFVKQSVPAFAASEMMSLLRKKYPDYSYKEAALNPTNPRNKAEGWEADIVKAFDQDGDRAEISGMRVADSGPSLYLARPFRIKDGACLACHDKPEIAPVSMVKLYGADHGFGWQLNQVIGAQVVSVPMSLPIRNANHAFYTFMASLGAVFGALFIILNLMLYFVIVRPVRMVAAAADRMSAGRTDMSEEAPLELPESGKDEIGVLARSFNRMRRDLEQVLKVMDRR